MSLQGYANIDVALDFTVAGVGFSVKVQADHAADSGPTLHVGLHAIDPDQTARFSETCSHALGDFVGSSHEPQFGVYTFYRSLAVI